LGGKGQAHGGHGHADGVGFSKLFEPAPWSVSHATWTFCGLLGAVTPTPNLNPPPPTPADIKYIDPTYMIQATACNSLDHIFTRTMAYHAVDAAFAGYTGVWGGVG
jgi:hypothetical protein